MYRLRLGHEFGEWQVIVPATTTSEGVQSHTCSRCGQVENEMIEKLTPTEESKEESVPAIESSDAEDSKASAPSQAEEQSGSGNKTIFFIIGAVVILLTVGYIVIMAINKKKNY